MIISVEAHCRFPRRRGVSREGGIPNRGRGLRLSVSRCGVGPTRNRLTIAQRQIAGPESLNEMISDRKNGRSPSTTGGAEERFTIAPACVVETRRIPVSRRSAARVLEFPGGIVGDKDMRNGRIVLREILRSRGAANSQTGAPGGTLSRKKIPRGLGQSRSRAIGPNRPLPGVGVVDFIHETIRLTA